MISGRTYPQRDVFVEVWTHSGMSADEASELVNGAIRANESMGYWLVTMHPIAWPPEKGDEENRSHVQMVLHFRSQTASTWGG